MMTMGKNILRCMRVFKAQLRLQDTSFTLQAQVKYHTSNHNSKAVSKVIGNLNFNPYNEDKVLIPKWKHLWMLMMRRKAEIDGGAVPEPRSNQLNWNYEAELQAFISRLQIQLHSDILRVALMEPISVTKKSSDTVKAEDNESLVKSGGEFASRFIRLYCEVTFSKLPTEGIDSIVEYLSSENVLSEVAENLGYVDLVQTQEFPVSSEALRRCFLATTSAIMSGSGGPLAAGRFLLDFVVTNLIDKDIVEDIWKPWNPMGILTAEFVKRKLPMPEVRILKQSGVTTVTPVYFVGIFSDQQLVVESGGETVIKAESDAAKLALKKLYGVSINELVLKFDTLDDPDVADQVERLAHDIPIFSKLDSNDSEVDDIEKLIEPVKQKRKFFPKGFF